MIVRINIENFKAVNKSGSLDLQPFTVFIGNNGSGKSSVLEALRLLQNIVRTDLNTAFIEWGGLDKVRNYNALIGKDTFEPVKIELDAIINENSFRYSVHLNTSGSGDYFLIVEEALFCNHDRVLFSGNAHENRQGNTGYYFTNNRDPDNKIATTINFPNNKLLLCIQETDQLTIDNNIKIFRAFIESWQFLSLNAHEMGKPVLMDRVNRDIILDYEGRNIASYLLWMQKQGQEYLDNLIQKLHFILPYLKDLQPDVHDSVNREVELLLFENNEHNKKPIPGWLLSSGTLRIIALLAMFETPKKPSVLFIDEVENGLDPRTIGLLINMIQEVYEEKNMQVIVTTHSPYFLDLVPLESIIVSEKNNKETYFHIPKDEEGLEKWRERFSPGKLYTMGKLTK